MTRIVPFDTTYTRIRNYERIAFILLIFSSIMITSHWLLAKIFFSFPKNQIENLKEAASVLSYVGMVLYLLINLLAKILFHYTEKIKRNDLVDNSFGTNYSNENTLGYYNNSEIQEGVKKLALNTYESSFHTEHTLKHMVFKNLVFRVIFSVPFLLSVFSKNGNEVVRLLFEISIPITLFSQLVITIIYYINVSVINERFKIELTNIGDKQMKQDDIAKILIPVLEYHCIKAWSNINLDSKIFMKYNQVVSEKWTKIKENLN